MKSLVLSAAFLLAFSGAGSASTFDGTWSFKVTSTHGNCFAAPGRVVISDGNISGELKGVSETFEVTGKVSDSGVIKGRIGSGAATFRGKFANGSATATWRSREGCRGKIAIQ